MIDIVPLAAIALGLWLIGVICGVWLADAIAAAFDVVVDLFKG